MARHRVGERQTGLDVLPHRDQRLAQLLGLGLPLEHVQRPQDRHPGVDHRRQLAREDGQVTQLDPLQEVEVDLLGVALGVDVEDDQPAGLELVGDRLLVLGVDLAAGRHAREVDRAEDEGGHGLGHSSEVWDFRRHRLGLTWPGPEARRCPRRRPRRRAGDGAPRGWWRAARPAGW